MGLRRNIAGSLKSLHDSAQAMDEILLFPINVDVLRCLDGDIFNPEVFRAQELERCEKHAESIGQRMVYLKVRF